MSDGWSYFTWVTKTPSVEGLDRGLNALGADGWELTTSLSTVKSIVGNAVGNNDVVLIFKKAGAGQVPSDDARNLAYHGRVDPPTW